MNHDPGAERLRAILLVGPTGSGKTPLGDWLEQNGILRAALHHFDFGANLRQAVANDPSARFDENEIRFLRRVLEEGVLLEDDSFYLADRILSGFVADRQVGCNDWLIMNGLPRHAGQAVALEKRLKVRAVVELVCEPKVIQERLRRNTGGDRADRTDDLPSLVERKLAVYEERTRPLVEHYQQQGSMRAPLEVGESTSAADLGIELQTTMSQLFGVTAD